MIRVTRDYVRMLTSRQDGIIVFENVEYKLYFPTLYDVRNANFIHNKNE